MAFLFIGAPWEKNNGSALFAPLLSETDADIHVRFPVMVQLRPHLLETEFVDYVRHQEQDGYRLTLLEDNSQV
jgi:hypothetical protein